MKISLQPSPAIIVNADATIGECVAAMNRQNVGSVLVVNNPGELIGIFTERDLLRVADFVQQGAYWSRSIGKVMTKPVTSLDLSRLDEAPRVMLDRGFRHLPITHQDSQGKKRLVGVISMRDLFRTMLQYGFERTLSMEHTVKTTAVLTDDDAVLQLTKGAKVLPFGRLLREEKLDVVLKGIDRVFVDLDSMPENRWADFLKKILNSTKTPRVILIYDPQKHQEKTVGAIEKLKTAKKVSLFTKPLDLFSFFQVLDSSTKA